MNVDLQGFHFYFLGKIKYCYQCFILASLLEAFNSNMRAQCIRCPLRLTSIRPVPDPSSLEDSSTYRRHLGIFIIGIVGASSSRLFAGVVTSTIKSASACPLVASCGVNSISNQLNSIAYFKRQPEASSFWMTCRRGQLVSIRMVQEQKYDHSFREAITRGNASFSISGYLVSTSISHLLM